MLLFFQTKISKSIKNSRQKVSVKYLCCKWKIKQWW